MKEIKVRVGRFQSWRFKLGVRLINCGVWVCGEANQALLKNVVSHFNSEKG